MRCTLLCVVFLISMNGLAEETNDCKFLQTVLKDPVVQEYIERISLIDADSVVMQSEEDSCRFGDDKVGVSKELNSSDIGDAIQIIKCKERRGKAKVKLRCFDNKLVVKVVLEGGGCRENWLVRSRLIYTPKKTTARENRMFFWSFN